MPRHIHAVIICLAVGCLAAPGFAQAPVAALRMIGGGEVTLRQDRDVLFVTVSGPQAGLASLCVGDESRVRILHASAAIGEASYERSAEHWVLRSKFDFKLRETRTGPPSESDRMQYLTNMGWVANASRSGDAVRRFTVNLTERLRYLGVTYLSTTEPMALSYWPPSMKDGCREVKIAQGYLPETAQFHPASWHPIK
ncbi:MAG TPA: hypothetical protein VEA16_07775 [Vicinamibacterales bacterium]|nr:hypothetical protein [Vicinamibacterales bacterium]